MTDHPNLSPPPEYYDPPRQVRECDACGEINKTLILRARYKYGIRKDYWYCEDCYDVVVAARKEGDNR